MIEQVQIKGRTKSVIRRKLSEIDPCFWSAKLTAKGLPLDTTVYILCDSVGEPILRAGHYSIHRIDTCLDPL